MNRIWQPEGEFEVALMFAEPSAISVHYYFDSSGYEDFSRSLYTRVRMDRPSPAAELVLLLEDFNIDWFQWTGSVFVSERMREVMALDAAEARFFEVDDSKSAALPRSKRYQMMEPEKALAVLDLDRTQYHMRQFMPNLEAVPERRGRMALKVDAAPQHDLFYDSFFTKELFCSDAFALRVLRSGCTGLSFMDPNSRGERNLFRTLRGLEEEVGLDAHGAKTSRLVEAID